MMLRKKLEEGLSRICDVSEKFFLEKVVDGFFIEVLLKIISEKLEKYEDIILHILVACLVGVWSGVLIILCFLYIALWVVFHPIFVISDSMKKFFSRMLNAVLDFWPGAYTARYERYSYSENGQNYIGIRRVFDKRIPIERLFE